MLLVEQPGFTLRLPDGWKQLESSDREQLLFESSDAHLVLSVMEHVVPAEKLEALTGKLAEIRLATERENVPGVRHAPPSIKRKADDHYEVMYAAEAPTLAFCFWGVVTTHKVFSCWLSAEQTQSVQRAFAQLVPAISLVVP